MTGLPHFTLTRRTALGGFAALPLGFALPATAAETPRRGGC
jgi:hypothetical protein